MTSRLFAGVDAELGGLSWRTAKLARRLVAAAVVGSPDSSSAALEFLIAWLDRFVELFQAIRLRRDRRELSSTVLGERRVVFLQVLDQVRARHAVVDVRADCFAGADGLGRIAEPDAYFVRSARNSPLCAPLTGSSTPGSECAGTARTSPRETPRMANNDFIGPPSMVACPALSDFRGELG